MPGREQPGQLGSKDASTLGLSRSSRRFRRLSTAKTALRSSRHTQNAANTPPQIESVPNKTFSHVVSTTRARNAAGTLKGPLIAVNHLAPSARMNDLTPVAVAIEPPVFER